MFDDVRETLRTLPYFDPASHGYALMDLFTVRHALIEDLDPQPRSVFEFGTLYGYFLITALDAAPSIERVGWVDNEAHTTGSNAFCAENITEYCRRQKRELGEVWCDTETAVAPEFGQADLVQVDAAHGYDDCMADLGWALRLEPRVVFVDDYKAITTVREATDDFARDHELEVEYHETVNGLAVLRLEN